MDRTPKSGHLFGRRRPNYEKRLSNSAICVALPNPLRLHCLDKLVKTVPGAGPMNRDD